MPGDKVADLVKRLGDAVSAPILYPTGFQLPAADVTDALPTQLPPLRPDSPTLVIGHIKPAQTLAYTVQGTVAGEVKVHASEPVGEPELDNFFLVGMFDQWKNAKDEPALMPADRALAFAQELNLMARTELMSQGQLALAGENLGAAAMLFEQAKGLDPQDVQVEGGLKLVQMLQDGKVTKEQMRHSWSSSTARPFASARMPMTRLAK